MGPPGTGKSSLAVQFVVAALARGDKAALFAFEESLSNLLHRADGLRQPLREGIARGLVQTRQVDPGELSPGQFADAVRQAVRDGAKVVVIDSLSGYMNAVPDERFLATHLHELLTFLGQHRVLSILVGVQHGMLGGSMSTQLDASYVADNVLMLRYFELDGEIQQAISVFKKRGGPHERTLRQFTMDQQGMRVGKVLRGYRGLLTGVPVQLRGGEGDAG
jgi:circadian clock protein KaiC